MVSAAIGYQGGRLPGIASASRMLCDPSRIYRAML